MKRKSLLLVEDDTIDVMTVKRAFQQLNIQEPLSVVGNGEEALAFLRDAGNSRPGLILLDINMPRMNGIEFLEVMKSEEALKTIPVVVLTTSKEDQDRFETFNLGVAGYMIKPVDYDQFVNVISTVHEYWKTSELPDK